MVSKVHLTIDFSAKEAGINLKLAECIQETYINLNPQLHKSWPYVLKCVFYWRLTFILVTFCMYNNKHCCCCPAAEDHREGPHSLEQQSGHVATQV